MAKMYHEDGSVENYRSPRSDNPSGYRANHRESWSIGSNRQNSGNGVFHQEYRGNNRSYATRGEFTRTSFNITVGAVLFYGFLMNFLICKHMTGFFTSMNPIVLIIGYIICVIIGGMMSAKSDNPIISFLGYNLVVLPVGAVLSVCLAGVAPDLIVRAATVTAGVTGIMLIGAMVFPEVFRSMGRILFFSLIAVIIVEIVCMLFGVFMPTFWDWLVAALFALYIGYDWAIAQEYDCTIDNAIDACVGLYLNIVNLFLRVLSIMERRD